MSRPSAHYRDMGAKRVATFAVVTTIRAGFGQRQLHGFPDLCFVPPPESPIDRVPVAVLGRDIAPWRAATQPPEYPVDDRAVLFGTTTVPLVLCPSRQQALQKAVLDQSRR